MGKGRQTSGFEAAGMPDQHLQDIVDCLYSAPFEPANWQKSVDLMNGLLPSVAFALYGHDFVSNRNLGEIHAGFDQRAMDDYAAYYHTKNVWADGFANAKVGALLHSDSFFPRELLKSTEYYNDWLRQQDGQVAGWGSLLANDSGRFLAFSTTYRERDEVALSPQVKRLVENLMGHVERAFRLSRAFAMAGPLAGVEEVFERVPDALFLIDHIGRIVFANGAGRKVVAAREILTQLGSRLCFATDSAHEQFTAAMNGIASGEIGKRTSHFGARTRLGRTANCTLVPFGRHASLLPEPFFHFVEHNTPFAVLIIEDHQPGIEDILVNQHGLTRAETEVALALKQGASIAEVADGRKTSQATVRNQIRNIFEKLDVHRQTELVAMLNALT